MLQIEQIKRRPEEPERILFCRAAKILRIPKEAICSLQVQRRAVDARDGIQLIYTVRVEVSDQEKILSRCKNRLVSAVKEEAYRLPPPVAAPEQPPVVVGAGPGGLFCALALARCGARPILLEQGWAVERRKSDISRFWQIGELDCCSNVQFGEGGAGAFSDGKLSTGTRDIRHRFILDTFVSHGAPESILYDAKPHVGTDYLHRVLASMREELLSLGCDIRFGHRLDGLAIEGGLLTAAAVEGPEGRYLLPTGQLVLAPGNSARSTFHMLQEAGVALEAKPLAVGVRIEHRQRDIDAAQYKSYAGHPALGAASYKLSCHTAGGRSVFSFCVCPGGTVVAAASEAERLVTNGMSLYARDGENINGGLLVSISPEDYPGDGPLSGIDFQRALEERAFIAGGGGYIAPAQRVEDFLAHRPSSGPSRVTPTYRPGVNWCDLWQVLPAFICEALEEALPVLERKIHGFADGDAVLTAVESRSSCPVRILRDESGQSTTVRGLFPCGEGAGYAGGIMSAAADGIKCAELVLQKLHERQGYIL